MSIMLKRCILPSIALILANLLTAWAKDSPGSSSALPSGAEALIYENKALDLCLTLPAGWREVKLMDKAKHACMFTRGEDIFFYVTPAPTNRTWSAQAVLNETISRLLQANTDLREVPPREVYPLEHGAAIVAMFQRPRTGRATLIVWVAGVSIHARGFGVVCTAPPVMLTTLKPEWI
ncbi:MAG TPA: hypothetical protein EYP10_01005, partial [Armatimonadetes bacterium]|nr:hypothetical protein [Armatimonadota bacterium]